MTQHAIPTTYKGVNFRSRLEARWAAFFDRARWTWAYEPLEFAGWIPDFAVLKDYQLMTHPVVGAARVAQIPEPVITEHHDHISGHTPSELLIEVKPALNWPALSLHRKRVDKAGALNHPVLLVGAEVPISQPTLGIGQLKWAQQWGPAQLGWCTKACGGRLTVMTPNKTCLLCSMSLLGETQRTRATSIAHEYWIGAGNDTQWRSA